MAADAGGNLWVAATESGKLLKVDSRTGAVTKYSPPTKETGLIAVDVDRKQNLIWFSEIFWTRLVGLIRALIPLLSSPIPAPIRMCVKSRSIPAIRTGSGGPVLGPERLAILKCLNNTNNMRELSIVFILRLLRPQCTPRSSR